MCMLYVEGFESESNDDSRGIIIGENINQQIIFENGLKKVNFVYPHATPSKDIAIKFNVIDKAFYKLTVFADNKSIRTDIVTRTQIFFIRGSTMQIMCKENNICPITIQVEYTKKSQKLILW